MQLAHFTDTTACNGDTVLLNAFIDSSYSYKWSDGVTTPVRRISKTGTYNITISDNKCTSTVFSRNIRFNTCFRGMAVPTAFTPNNDGLNDVFRARDDEALQSFSLSVYNRSGQRIFFSTDISKGWDGTIKRVQQNGGVYVWVVTYTDQNGKAFTQKGTVVLIR